MAKPTKPEFGANGIVPSSKLAAAAELAEYGANPPACIAARVANQSIPTGVVTSISLDTEIIDTVGTMFAAGTTITVPDAGVYLITAGGTWGTISATGVRLLFLLQTGVEIPGGAATSPGDATQLIRQSTSGGMSAAAGDTVTLQAFQTSAGAMNFVGRLTVVRVSGS